MRGNAARFPDAQESVRAATTRLTLLLLNARDEAFARFTAEGLASTHRVPLKVVEVQLQAARERRARG